MPSDSVEYPLDKWLASVQECQLLKEEDFKKVCDLAREYLIEESNVQSVNSPVNICGDIHGQFFDLLKLFQVNGEIADSNANYIFMGDYVDRGHHSLETITYLLLLKCKYPERITLLRGNHESRQITQQYGFYDEILQKYGTTNAYRQICDVFDWLPLAALVDNQVLCVHGGISPDAKTIDAIRTIKRKQEIPCASREEFATLSPQERSFADLMWSDPEEDIVDNWAPNPRGVGWVFGKIPVSKFNQNNGLELICRSHQLAEEGFKYMFDEQLVTIWSAPNYCYRCGNDAAVLSLDEKLNRTFTIFKESPMSTPKQRTTAAYFL